MIGLLSAPDLRGVEIVLASVPLACCRKSSGETRNVPSDLARSYFWFTDSVLIGRCFDRHTCDSSTGRMALLAASAHLAIVRSSKKSTGIWMSASVAFAISRSIFYVGQREHVDWNTSERLSLQLFISALAARGCSWHARRSKIARMSSQLIDELKEFTGYSDDKIRDIWATSNEQLAKNWKDAHLDESDREKMTAWYRENSELYMFAISGYNLEYKRIRDSIKMLRFGRGACLDYGAGNGEIILELARRGHAAIYFDVDGTSMRFARFRAEQQKLAVEFFHSKDDLAASAKQRGLDTVFSFDVLEHLPDLPGELKFLSSLLNSGGRMAFDVPAGSTKAHPMHLNHHLDVNAYMESIGMMEERGLMESIPFKKQEKFVFRKPA